MENIRNRCIDMKYLIENKIYCGDSTNLINRIIPNSISLSFWSPPYFLGKEYEIELTFDTWQLLLYNIIKPHSIILKPGGFLVINIADILSFKDEKMPKIMGLNPANRKCNVTKEMILELKEKYPNYTRYKIAKLLNCSEQTIDRRLNGNNIRGGKYSTGTHVKLVGSYLEKYAYESGLFLYDKRIWKKDPTWQNSRWINNTLKAVSETEDLYIFWKPGEFTINKNRLTPTEWKNWGYRQIWEINSVRSNSLHPAMFPLELAERVIKLYTDEGDIVLDPFLGSGTTVIAAIKLHRKYIGIELMEKYFNLSLFNINKFYKTFNKQGNLI